MANNNDSSNQGFASDAMSEEEKEQARSKGGQNSPSQFGGPEGADPSEAGKKGAEAQPVEAKQEGGENSNRSEDDTEEEEVE